MTGLASLLELLGSGLLAALLTGVGLLTEQAALATLSGGPAALGVWELAMGLLLLYAGIYMLGYKRVWLGLHEALAS